MSARNPRSFRDRREAGRVLAGLLAVRRGQPDVVVLGLARGGVPVAWEIAAALQVPLDVFLVRKLGAPQWPELAMGAVASGGGVVINESVRVGLHITDGQLRDVLAREERELERRELVYRAGRPPLDLRARSVILVDDGVATGASMRVAVQAVRRWAPTRVTVAVPVGPKDVHRQFASDADEVVCAVNPSRFEAVGQVFADFDQVGDDQVRDLLSTPTTGAQQT